VLRGGDLVGGMLWDAMVIQNRVSRLPHSRLNTSHNDYAQIQYLILPNIKLLSESINRNIHMPFSFAFLTNLAISNLFYCRLAFCFRKWWKCENCSM